MNEMNRRSFLKTATLGAAAFSLPAASWAQVTGANEVIRVGVVGFGGRGGDHIGGMRRLAAQGVRIVALSDVDRKILDAGVESFAKRNERVKGYVDFREMLDDGEVDVVTFATPNHWHALNTVWACQAGKDVYVEKPISHNVWEGRKAVEAARKYKRVVQAGTQCRSSFAIRDAVEWVRAGNLGKITVSRGLCYKPRRSIGKADGPQPIPAGIDYDLWCGPAPKVPLRRKRLHYDWHWVWDTGNGDLGNQGIHQMDIARWFLGEDELSPMVLSVGGRLGYEDDGETPNTQFVYHGYKKAPLIFEVRGLPRAQEFQTDKGWNGNMDKFQGAAIGVIVHCEGGHVVVPDYTSATAYDLAGQEIKKWSGADDHYENFIKAVRSRKVKELNSDILEGHLSSALCHTGNISYLLGTRSTPDAVREAIRGEKEALETYERMADHLKANGIDLAGSSPVTLGPVLTMNPGKEVFKKNDRANALLKRDYRMPFVVPERV
ncbi:MAG: Gfo/Idh/MocA family oxidoreductase [Verrucomicrobia bacterium]|nr:Gfo/Idh/MocA family oxidoreductase [Verrucomicrobiota bacterium]